MMTSIGSRRVWRIAPDGDGRKWALWQQHRCIAFGWPAVDDYRGFASSDDLRRTIEAGDPRGDGKTDFPRVRMFAYYMSVGDIVIAGGAKNVYGVGTIASDYRPRTDLENPLRSDPDHPHVRDVDWLDVEPFQLSRPMFQPNALQEVSFDRWREFLDAWTARNGGLTACQRLDAKSKSNANAFAAADRLLRLDHDVPTLEGERFAAWRTLYTRDRQYRDAFIASRIARREPLACEACGFDFAIVYGTAVGGGYAHVHHEDAIAGRGGDAPTTANRIRIVCANCHAMIHRHGACRTVDEIKQMIDEHAATH